MIWTPEELKLAVTLAVIPLRTSWVAVLLGRSLLAVMSIGAITSKQHRVDEAACLEALDRLIVATGLRSFRDARMVIENPQHSSDETRAVIRAWLDAAGRRYFGEVMLMNRQGWRSFGLNKTDREKVLSMLGAQRRAVEENEIRAARLAAFAAAHPALGTRLRISYRLWSRASSVVVSAALRSRLAKEQKEQADASTVWAEEWELARLSHNEENNNASTAPVVT